MLHNVYNSEVLSNRADVIVDLGDQYGITYLYAENNKHEQHIILKYNATNACVSIIGCRPCSVRKILRRSDNIIIVYTDGICDFFHARGGIYETLPMVTIGDNIVHVVTFSHQLLFILLIQE